MTIVCLCKSDLCSIFHASALLVFTLTVPYDRPWDMDAVDGEGGRASGPADLSSGSAQIQSGCSFVDWVSDLPFAPEKLEALISLDTGVWGFLFALATFLTYQSPPTPLLACSLLSLPVQTLQSVQPSHREQVTVAVVKVINTCVKSTWCHLHPLYPVCANPVAKRRTLCPSGGAANELWWPKYQHH